VDAGLLVALAGWLAGWWLLWRLPVVGDQAAVGAAAPAGDASATRAGCTVVIPARDEEGSLPLLLASLADQTVRPRRVVVVDDHSTDATGELARRFEGVTVLDAPDLPPGWLGKPWACHVGAGHEAGAAHDTDTLVFLDADVRLAPDGRASLLGELERRGGVVSVQPFHRTERPYEQLSAEFNVAAVMGLASASPGRDGRARAANGPCLALRRELYHAIGGHAAVRNEIVEDVALGRATRALGEPVVVLGGGARIAFRMYPGGPGQLVEGWSKNLASGAASVGAVRLVAMVAWVTALCSPLQLLAEGALGSDGRTVAYGVALYGACAVQQRVMLRQLGDFRWWTAAGYPIPVLAFVAVFLRSLWLTLVRRRVTWRGRTIPLATEGR
jgi:4,4'-diaponeurosporenoate glycosyltransferase